MSFVCPICLSNNNKYIRLHKSIETPSEHKFCSECITTYVELEIKQFNLEIKCPLYSECKHVLTKTEFAQFLTTPFLRNKYNEILQTKYLDTLKIFYCECGEAYEVEHKRNVYCVKCNKESCSECSLPVHGGDCIKIDPTQRKLVKDGILKHCPKCKVIIEKNKGCNHMTCTRCKYQFWWDNLEKFDPRNLRHGPRRERTELDDLAVERLAAALFLRPEPDTQSFNGHSIVERKLFVPPPIPPRPPPTRLIRPNEILRAADELLPQEIKNQEQHIIRNPSVSSKKELINMYNNNRSAFNSLCNKMNVSNVGLIVDSMRINVLAKIMNIH